MKLKDLNIGTQLFSGFSIILLLVITLGIVSDNQTHKIHDQTKLIYEHPLQVRSAIGSLTSDIHQMRLGTRDLMLADNEQEQQDAMISIEMSSLHALKQFDIIFALYSGSLNDVEAAYQAFIKWKTNRGVNNSLALSKDIQKIKESVATSGDIGILRENMLHKIRFIDEQSKIKAESLYKNSYTLKETLTNKLILLIIFIVVITLLIYFLLLHLIRTPLEMLTKVTRRFDEGGLSVRCDFESKNELGMMSASFNSLADNIETSSILNTQTELLSDILLIEDDLQRFFQITLQIIMEETKSQMAAVYLLSDNKKTFDHFESIGLADNAKKSFSAKGLEGEIGLALSTKKIQHFKSVPNNTRFVFNAMSGKIIPCEMITIPILSRTDVIAVVALTSLSPYSEISIQLINRMYQTYCARIDKILTYQKLRLFSDELTVQNHELEAQKIELTSQSSELTEQNRELEIQKQQLSEASKLKTSFLSNMSHELRTPLNSVIALSGVLNRRLNGQIPEEEYSYLEVIERNGKSLLSLINNILDISRIESGHEEIELSEINVCDCINDVVAMIQPQAAIKTIELQKVTGTCNVTIQSDTQKIIHILQNLIGNAVKFTEKGAIKISVSQSDQHVIIVITDSGIGISPENLPHIFDEFRQADGGTSRRYGGTGLGLAIAKKYAYMLGGNITVKSEKDVGSEFILTLPLVYIDENTYYTDDNTSYVNESASIEESNILINEKPTSSETLKPLSTQIAKTILIVEDSEPAIIQLKDILEESGYQIIVANNGNEGLKIISGFIPDAIILDLMMPDVDGFELLESIRNVDTTASIPVLILTAKHITKDELKTLKRNNIYQLIQKGNVNKFKLLEAIKGMVSTSY